MKSEETIAVLSICFVELVETFFSPFLLPTVSHRGCIFEYQIMIEYTWVTRNFYRVNTSSLVIIFYFLPLMQQSNVPLPFFPWIFKIIKNQYVFHFITLEKVIHRQTSRSSIHPQLYLTLKQTCFVLKHATIKGAMKKHYIFVEFSRLSLKMSNMLQISREKWKRRALFLTRIEFASSVRVDTPRHFISQCYTRLSTC